MKWKKVGVSRVHSPSSLKGPWRGLDHFSARTANVMKARFRGRFEVKLDPKGRISLPAAFRAAVGGARSERKIVVANGRYQNKPYLNAHSFSEWAALERRIGALPSLKPEVQAFQRFYLSSGQEIEVDEQGRFSIPLTLRRYAALESDATLVGLGDKFEIWPADAWASVHEALSASFDETMAAVARLTEAK